MLCRPRLRAARSRLGSQNMMFLLLLLCSFSVVHTSDHYATLGVPSKAPTGDIKRAYRAAARQSHPDKNPGERAQQQHSERTATQQQPAHDCPIQVKILQKLQKLLERSLMHMKFSVTRLPEDSTTCMAITSRAAEGLAVVVVGSQKADSILLNSSSVVIISSNTIKDQITGEVD